MNKDGLKPGQDVSWDEMVRANKARKAKPADDTPEPITREDIADMKKADVTELLEAQGASTDGNLPELRERLIATMFLDA